MTRIVVGVPTTEPDQQFDQMSEFAERFGLTLESENTHV